MVNPEAFSWGLVHVGSLYSHAVVADGFGRAGFHRFRCRGVLFRGGRLVMNERISDFIVPFKDRGRERSAEITVGARGIDIKWAGDILAETFSEIRHGCVVTLA